jgi:hypothetical protein
VCCKHLCVTCLWCEGQRIYFSSDLTCVAGNIDMCRKFVLFSMFENFSVRQCVISHNYR